MEKEKCKLHLHLSIQIQRKSSKIREMVNSFRNCLLDNYHQELLLLRKMRKMVMMMMRALKKMEIIQRDHHRDNHSILALLNPETNKAHPAGRPLTKSPTSTRKPTRPTATGRPAAKSPS